MENRWSDEDAASSVEAYGAKGFSPALALRVYTSRLIGCDTSLVLHGGGNTSVKDEATDPAGQSVQVLRVKGSGWDLATIEPQGFPAVRLEPLRALRDVKTMSDQAMVNALRINLLNAADPNPSVETLLHAFLPHRFVDHTHADAILALVDQPHPEARCAELFGGRLAILPFIFPGFPLAAKAASAFEAQPEAEGILLINHGLFTFGDTAKQSYERMIEMVRLAESALAQGNASGRANPAAPASKPGAIPEEQLAAVSAVLRGGLATADARANGGFRRMVLHRRSSPVIRAFVDDAALGEYALRGVATPDHIIRTKNVPLILPTFDGSDMDGFGNAVRGAIADYGKEYERYFRAGAAKSSGEMVMLDPLPRILLLPGSGMYAVGKTEGDARIAADIYEHTIDIIQQAEGLGRYTPLGPEALFEMEYWELEQAKLGKAIEPEFLRTIVLITGAASGIGAATALAFARLGAHIVALDRDREGLDSLARQAAESGGSIMTITGDVTQPSSVQQAFDDAARRFGGVDIVISNAGAVWQGNIAECSDEDLRSSFELNFFAHQSVAKAAVQIFRLQQTGGVLLFNASKSAFNPGPRFGPYSLPKAATIALMRQYALDYGHLGVRSNAVNADRVPTALFDEGVLESRAEARGLSVEAYLSGNLLGRAVSPHDVAQAFVSLARAEKTSGAVIPVDGGNIAAAPR